MGGIFHDAGLASASLYLKNLKYLWYHDRPIWTIYAQAEGWNRKKIANLLPEPSLNAVFQQKLLYSMG